MPLACQREVDKEKAIHPEFAHRRTDSLPSSPRGTGGFLVDGRTPAPTLDAIASSETIATHINSDIVSPLMTSAARSATTRPHRRKLLFLPWQFDAWLRVRLA